MDFFPYSIKMNPIILFSITLVLGLLGGEITRISRFLPRISGYIGVGILLGPNGLNIISPSTLASTRFFIDIPLSLILFELGRNLDFTWLKHDKGLLHMALAETTLTFISVFMVLYILFDFNLLPSALGATIAISTSAAVVMMVANDVESEGPVTRRALMLTSLNNLFSITLFTLLSPFINYTPLSKFNTIICISTYKLFGSILLGILMFVFAKYLAQIIKKHRENQFVLFVAMVMLTLGLARSLNLSAMLSLFALGVSARNFDSKHLLMEINFGWWARIFFILLFVVTGAHLQLEGLWQAALVILTFLIVRTVSKTLGVLLFAKSSRITSKQAVALSLTLFPMAGVAVGMSINIMDFDPNFGKLLLTVISATIAILTIIGPLLTQFAFISTGEASLINCDKEREPANE